MHEYSKIVKGHNQSSEVHLEEEHFMFQEGLLTLDGSHNQPWKKVLQVQLEEEYSTSQEEVQTNEI